MSDLMFHQFNGRVVQQRPTDGYFNLTSMCRASNKLIADYLRLESTKEYLTALSENMGFPIDSLVNVKAGRNGGAWGHPEIAVDCAQWCNVQLRIMVNRWISEWKHERIEPEVTQLPIDTEIRKLELQVELARIELERDRMRLAITQPKEFYREPKNQPVEAVPVKKTTKEIIKDIPAGDPAFCKLRIAGDPKPALQMFVDECLEVTLNWGDRLTNEEIHKAYVEYCEATYSPQHGYPKFIKELAAILPGCRQKRMRSKREWIGAHWARLRIKPHPKAN